MTTALLPCSECGTLVTIPARFGGTTSATCLKCSDTGATPFSEKFSELFYAGWYSDLLKHIGRRAARNKALRFVGKVALFFAFSGAAACIFGAVYAVWLMPTVWLWETVSPLLGMAWAAGFLYLSNRFFNR